MDQFSSVADKDEDPVNAHALTFSPTCRPASGFFKESASGWFCLLVHAILGLCARAEFPTSWADSQDRMDQFSSVADKDEDPVNAHALTFSPTCRPASGFFKESASGWFCLLVHAILGLCARAESLASWTDSQDRMDQFSNVSDKDEDPVNVVGYVRSSRLAAGLPRPPLTPSAAPT